jgi:hypothetical protein
MQPDLADAVIVADAGDGAYEVARLDRAAGTSGEDESGIHPGRAEVGAVCFLMIAAGGQGDAGEPEYGQVARTSASLDRADAQLALDALDLLADGKDTVAEVDVLAAQAEHFTAPHAVQQQEHERGVERIIGGSGEEGQGFRRRPRLDLCGLLGGQLDQAGDVAGDEFGWPEPCSSSRPGNPARRSPVLGAFAGLQAVHWRWDAIAALAVLGALGTGIAYVLNYRLITDEGTTASVVTYLLPIVAVILGAAILGDHITAQIISGMLIVILGVAVTRRTREPSTR